MQEKVFVSLKDREGKARKIEAVLEDAFQQSTIEGKDILDIGCGIGQISEYFAHTNRVVGVDVQDRLEVKNRSSFRFVLIDSSTLPFESNTFDIVFTNHVIEHVEDQHTHLREILRVLKPGGVCYCATPNWNFPVEPHYQIPLIHYLPRSLFHRVLQTFGLYKEDLHLLSYSEMFRLFSSEGFEVIEYTQKILKDPDRYHLGISITRFIPPLFLLLLTPFVPTNIFILKKR